jgi:hypothetical protein
MCAPVQVQDALYFHLSAPPSIFAKLFSTSGSSAGHSSRFPQKSATDTGKPKDHFTFARFRGQDFFEQPFLAQKVMSL